MNRIKKLFSKNLGFQLHREFQDDKDEKSFLIFGDQIHSMFYDFYIFTNITGKESTVANFLNIDTNNKNQLPL